MKKAKDPQAINVYFSPRLRADGELVLVRIKQRDLEIQLTKDQAKSLADQLQLRVKP